MTLIAREGLLAEELVDEDGVVVEKGYVKNFGFERKLDDWEVKVGDWIATTDSYEGDYALWLSSDEDETNNYVFQEFAVPSNVTIDVSIMIKTKDVDGGGAYVYAKVLDKDGDRVASFTTSKVKGTTDWIEFTKTLNTKTGDRLLLYLYHYKATGDVWFDDVELTGINNCLYSTNQSLELNGFDVEPLMELHYGSADIDTTGIIAGEPYFVYQPLSITYTGARPLVLSVIPNSTEFEGCELDSGEKCYDSYLIYENEELQFTFLENGVIYEYGGLTQKEGSTDKLQYLIQTVTVTNRNEELDLKDIDGAVYVPGECINRMESIDKIYWGDKYTKENACYFYIEELKAGETKTIEIEYSGDFVDVSFGPIEQDMSKQSTLDEQYVKRAVFLKPKAPLEAVSWNIEVDVPFWNETVRTNVSVVRPVLELNFDECEGDEVKDSSGNNNHGVIHGDAKWVKDDEGNCALEFDGVDDWVNIPHSSPLTFDNSTSFSICSKATPHFGDDKSHYLTFKYDKSTHYGTIYFRLGNIRFQLSDNKNLIITPTDTSNKYNENEPIYACGIYDAENSEMTLYINGQSSSTVETPGVNQFFNKADLIIGNYATNFFKGNVNGLSIFNGVLTKEQINSLYSRGEIEGPQVSAHLSKGILEYEIESQKIIENENNNSSLQIKIHNPINIDFKNIKPKILIPSGQKIVNSSVKMYPANNLTLSGSEVYFVVPIIKSEETLKYVLNYSSIALINLQLNLKTDSSTTTILPQQTNLLTGNVVGSISDSIKNLLGYSVKDLNDGLVLWLDFEEGQGNVTHDKSINNISSIMYGNPKWTVGKTGLALEFDGVDDYTKIPNINSFNFDNNTSFSVTGWAKPLFGKNESHYLIMNYDEITHYGTIYFRLGQIISQINDGTSLINTEEVTASEYQEDVWVHFASIYDSNRDKMSLYINGELASTVSTLGINNFTNKKDITLGNYKTNFFKGKIDDLRIFNRELSQEEIKGIYKGKTKVIIGSNSKINIILIFSAIILVVLIFGIIELFIKNGHKTKKV